MMFFIFKTRHSDIKTNTLYGIQRRNFAPKIPELKIYLTHPRNLIQVSQVQGSALFKGSEVRCQCFWPLASGYWLFLKAE
jgi:hypothetical protein